MLLFIAISLLWIFRKVIFLDFQLSIYKNLYLNLRIDSLKGGYMSIETHKS